MAVEFDDNAEIQVIIRSILLKYISYNICYLLLDTSLVQVVQVDPVHPVNLLEA